MNSSPNTKTASFSVDDPMLSPWAATGKLDEGDARLFAAALASDPALTDDLAAARAERDAVVALAGRLLGPSPQALAALFEAIDAHELGVNVVRLRVARSCPAPTSAQRIQKIGSLR